MDEDLMVLARGAIAGDPAAFDRFKGGILRLHQLKLPEPLPANWRSPALLWWLERHGLPLPVRGDLTNSHLMLKWGPLLKGVRRDERQVAAAAFEFEATLMNELCECVRHKAYLRDLDWFLHGVESQELKDEILRAAQNEPRSLLRYYFPTVRRHFLDPDGSPPPVLLAGDLVDVIEGGDARHFREGPYRARIREVYNDHEFSVAPIVPDPTGRHATFALGAKDTVTLVPIETLEAEGLHDEVRSMQERREEAQVREDERTSLRLLSDDVAAASAPVRQGDRELRPGRPSH